MNVLVSCDKSPVNCSNCVHSEPDNICHETLNVIYYCSCHNIETSSNFVCDKFFSNNGDNK